MAQETIITLADDLNGGDADETVSFDLDGVHYKTDLSEGNSANLRDQLAIFVAHGRRTGAAGRRVRAASTSATDPEQNQRIRS